MILSICLSALLPSVKRLGLCVAAVAPAQSLVYTPTWTQQTPATSPSARSGFSMAYDAATGQVVLFGGSGASNNFGDTWTWNGTTWTQQNPATSPSARAYSSMAYDAATGQIVLFGGDDHTGSALNDTWTWNGSTWTQQSPSATPEARYYSTMAYDAAAGQVVLFGGSDFNTLNITYNDTWTWNGTTWTKQNPATSPSARQFSSMAYDAATNQVVLFGGADEFLSKLGDTWTWNGTTWTQQTPATSPPATSFSSMDYDATTGQVVLFGGLSSGYSSGTWTWNGATWTQQTPVTSPLARFLAGMAYDAATSQMVLFGGLNGGNLVDTWTLQLGAVNLGTANVCPGGATTPAPCSQSATVNFTATTAATVAQVNALTQGAPNLDFTVSATTCVAALSPAQTCTVTVQFAPQLAGPRNGAVTLTDASGNLLGSVLLNGIGTGPQVVFPGNSATTSLGGTTLGGYSLPQGVAVDGAGNIYVSSELNVQSTIAKLLPGCISSACITPVGAGLSGAAEIALDGAGNIYVADAINSAVYEIPPACTSTSCVIQLGSGFVRPYGVAVDGAGNVYVADGSGNHSGLYSMPAGCASSSCVTQLNGGFNRPYGVAVDGTGNIYVADTNNSEVKKIPVGCASSSCVILLGNGFYGPEGVAVDGTGNVYVADTANNAVKKIPYSGGSYGTPVTLSSGFSRPAGVAVDGAGNVYVADTSNNAIKEIALATPPSLSFPTPTPVGTPDTTDGPLATTVGNIGNAPLTFFSPTPSVSAGFSLGTESTSCDQLQSATLAAGSTCTLTTSFAPLAGQFGSVSGSINLIDNNLNQASAQQRIPLSGTAEVVLTAVTHFDGYVGTVNLGSTTNFLIYIANPSATSALSNVSATVTLPSGLSFAGSSGGSCGTIAASGSTVTLSGISFAGGGSCQSGIYLTATQLGSQSVSTLPAASGFNGTASSVQVNVVDVPASLQITGAPSSAYLGGSVPFTVTVLDPLGNPDLAYTGTVAFTSSDTAANLPGSASLTNGTGSFTATFSTVANQTITATDTVTSLLTVTSGSIAVSIPNLVVTTNQDDAGSASNCTVQTTAGKGTDASCTLRDALAFASAAGSGNITFDSTAFSATNTAAQNTILETNGNLNVNPNTTISGPSGGAGVTLNGNHQNSVLFVGGGTGSVALNWLTITGGYSQYGGGIQQRSHATLTIANSSIVNNTSTYIGGGIFNANTNVTLTLINSTVSGNTGDLGGGIHGSGGTVNLISSTVTGNSAPGGYGGGLSYATLNAANSIVAGNSASTGNDTFAVALDNMGGNLIGTSNLNLGALGSYGGPTPTLLPLPGSPAICAGLTSISSVTIPGTDQRGAAHSANYCPAGTRDSGAVQTNYSLAFTQQPSSVFSGRAMTPAPTVTVTESGSVLTAGNASVTVTDGQSDLTSTFETETTSSGVATFNKLIFANAATSDSLAASLTLGNSFNLSVLSTTPFNVRLPTPTVTGISPAGGPVSGGSTVAIAGTNFVNGDTVKFGAVVATSVVVNSATQITATSPAGTGTVHVTVTDPVYGSSGATSADQFIYYSQQSYLVTTLTDDAGVPANCVAGATGSGGGNASCSLRDAMSAANALPAGVTGSITFASSTYSGVTAASPAVYAMSAHGTLSIGGSNTVTITGPTDANGNNLLAIDGGYVSSNYGSGVRIFNLPGGGSTTLNQLIIRNGYADGAVTLGTGGGNINVRTGSLVLTNSTVSGGYAGDGAGAGGININLATVTMANSTLSGNSAQGNGGGMYISHSTVTITNSTISGNSVGLFGSGAGIDVDSGTVAITNSTISGNSGAYYGGGITNGGATVTVTNVTFSANSANAQFGPDVFTAGGSTSIVNSIIPDGGSYSGSGNITSGTGLNLSALGNYGGPTQTFLPLPGSTAICAGGVPSVNSTPLTTDQRGVAISATRYGQTGCYDVGAVQTSYSLSFTTEPALGVFATQALHPAPVVTVSENGVALTAVSTAVNVTDTLSPSDLSGSSTLSVNTSTAPVTAGQASFSNLVFSAPVSSDGLTASLQVGTVGGSSPAAPILATASSTTFSVLSLVPTVTSVSPAAGAIAGGTTVTITGANYAQTTGLMFGSTPAASFTVTDGAHITAVSPMVTAGGPVDVTVTTLNGTSPTSAADQFTYYAPQSYVVTTLVDDAIGVPANCNFSSNSSGAGSGKAVCSLRDAIAAVNALPAGVTVTITFARFVYNGATAANPAVYSVSANGTLNITGNSILTITGPTDSNGNNLIAIDGGYVSTNSNSGIPILSLSNSGSTALNDLIVRNGNDQTSGGIVSAYSGIVTVTGSIFTGNRDAFGGIYVQGATAAVTNSTFSGNSCNRQSEGGGISIVSGTLTVAGSTFTGNTCNSGARFNNIGSGSAIYVYGGTATVTNSTFSGNTSDIAGALAVFGGTLTLANSTFSSNFGDLNVVGGSAAVSNSIMPDGTSGSYTGSGNITSSTGLNLSALGNYGGLTQTILPLPGSTAICAGTLANAQAADLAADQRGLPLNPVCPAGSVDAGAVQTNYVLSFTSQPPSSVFVGQTMSPAPAVTVTESGVALTAGTAAVGVTDTASPSSLNASSTLSANSSTASATAGQASFSNLVFSGVESSDGLTATLQVGTVAGSGPAVPVLLTSASSTFGVLSATPTISTSPTASAITYGQTLVLSTLTGGSASVAGSFAFTAPTTAPSAGTASQSVTFTPSSTNYTTVLLSVPVTVNQAKPTISTPPTASTITYGQTLASSTLTGGSASVSGKFTFTTPTTAPNAGTANQSVTFTPTDTTDYTTVSTTVALVVNKASTITTNAITTTQTVTGTTATITATVKPQIAGTPTGTITYWNGTTTLGSAAVGTSFTTPVLPAGTDQLTAIYSGDSNFNGSTSSATAVTGLAPSAVAFCVPVTKLKYPLSQFAYAMDVPLKNSLLTTGTITLYDGSTAIGTYGISPLGIYLGITPVLAVGNHSLKVVYNGDSHYPPGQSAVVVVTVVNQ